MEGQRWLDGHDRYAFFYYGHYCKIGSLAASLASINICGELVVRHYCLAGNNSPFNYLRVYLSNLIKNSNIRGFLKLSLS